jgi:hypothetical protein
MKSGAPFAHSKMTKGLHMMVAAGLAILVLVRLLLSTFQTPPDIGR